MLLLLFSRRGEFSGASTRLAHLQWRWVAATGISEVFSLIAYAVAQGKVLSASGARLKLAPLFAITLANNSIALSIPGEPVFSSAFRYRQYRRRGASEAQSGWTILTLMVAQAIGLSLLIFVAILMALLKSTRGATGGVAVLALIFLLGAGTVVVRRDLLVKFLSFLLRLCRKVTGHPKGDVGKRIDSVLLNMRAIRMSAGNTVLVVFIATLVWLFDCACLISALKAVNASVPWHGILLAYGVAQVVTALPIAPGGFGLVEGSLAVILVAYGATRISALSAVLTYRIVSYWLAIGVGWLSFFCIAIFDRRRDRRSASVASATSGAPPE